MASFNQQQQNNMQVRILEDQNRSLHELFKAPFDPSSHKQVPLYQRNLPKSFFVQPTGVNRGGNILSHNEGVGNMHMKHPSGPELIISHSKAHSSPACLDASYLNSSMLNDNHAHQKGHATNQDLFCNSLSQHSSQSPSQFSEPKFQQSLINEQTQQTNTTQGQSKHQSASGFNQHSQMRFQFCELSPCYEMAVNENNQVYFLNHKTQNTTWFDPRIPQEFQKWGMTLEQLEHLHIAYAREVLAMRTESSGSSEVANRNLPPPVHSRSYSQPTPTYTIGVRQSDVSPGSLSSSSSLAGGIPNAPPLTQVLQDLHLTGPQHSHQGSMDSGVGQSVTGQTPEHVMQHYDTAMGSCEMPADYMEGMVYPGSATPYTEMCLIDNFDINEMANT